MRTCRCVVVVYVAIEHVGTVAGVLAFDWCSMMVELVEEREVVFGLRGGWFYIP